MQEVLPDELEKFLHGALDPAQFRHADHIRVAFEMLRRHDFLDTARAYSNGLKALASKAGRPTAYHETITLAFLSLIAERLALRSFPDFDSFAAVNGELMDKSVLGRWYTPARLASEVARKTFLLPDPAYAP